MDDDHVGPEQLPAPGDGLLDGGAVVDDELEVEIRDPHARIARAGGRLADVAAAPAEPEVAALDRVQEHRPVEPVGRREGERGVALELCQPEGRAERGDDGPDEVGQDVLGVIELDVAEVAGVPGDVGDQEPGGLRTREHRPSPVPRRSPAEGPHRVAGLAYRSSLRSALSTVGCGAVDHGPRLEPDRLHGRPSVR